MFDWKHSFTKSALLLAAAAPALAQYQQSFESPAFFGSAAGTQLAGQDGFYIPDGGLVDGACFAYDGNALGVSPNLDGQQQFIACTRASADFARTQRNIDFSSSGCWFIDFDLNVSYNGVLPTANYAGSFSLQPYPQPGSISVVFWWDNVNLADTFTIRVLGYDAGGGTPYLAGLPVPEAGFRHLIANRWYRLSLRLDFDAVHALTGLSLHDIEAATSAGYVPGDLTGFYLGGGADSQARPTAIRVFAGGGSAGDHYAGNVVAIDNVRIIHAQDWPCFADLDLDAQVNLQDLAYLLSHFGEVGTATYYDGDLDCDRDVDLQDLAFLLGEFGTYCN
ncbi:MAG: hypothetical protein HZB38_07275 [Planctomycetes bacterium]|nr:hypothetical protein [Planctomycetota bacterium]